MPAVMAVTVQNEQKEINILIAHNRWINGGVGLSLLSQNWKI